MTSPIEAVVAIHNAFRADIASIDTAALGAANGRSGLEQAVDRFHFMNEALEWHALGEEAAMFPALEGVAPWVAEAYEKDHRALDAAFARYANAISTRDSVETARATAAFKYFLDVHLDKEDTHLYRIIRERVPETDQAKAVAVMAQEVPADRLPEFVSWMFPLMGVQDRENMTRVWQMLMPPEAFSGAVRLIELAIGDDFAELRRRIPELAA